MEVGETKVVTPLEPYETQVEFIQTLYKGLVNGYNMMLESPTGTGKTISLLTSAVHFLI